MAKAQTIGTENIGRNFHGLEHTQEEFHETEFEDCTFTGCDFSGVRFKRCRFTDCTFDRCNLSVMKVDQSEFRSVTFKECKMIGIDWTKALWPKPSLFPSLSMHACLVNDSSFFALSLADMVLEACTAHEADFREGSFIKGNFSQTDFAGSLFARTNLSGADFTDATGYDIDLRINTLSKAKFSRFEAVRLLESLGIELVD
ncbi:MAG: pentapeptide repeat-containing protein [Acidobacteriota bacterium]